MKVILLKDVPRVGQKYDVKEVANGYGRNYLLPRGLAKIATEAEIKRAEEKRRQIEQERAARAEALAKNIEALGKITITVKGKANDKGHLFAGIHKEDIAPLLKDSAGFEVDAEYIVLEHPIKETGEHMITVSLGDKSTQFKLVVEP